MEWPGESQQAGPVPLGFCSVKMNSDEGHHRLWLHRQDSSETMGQSPVLRQVDLKGLSTGPGNSAGVRETC